MQRSELSHSVDRLQQDDIGFLKSVWSSVRRNSNSTVQKGQTNWRSEERSGPRLSHGKTLEKLKSGPPKVIPSNRESILEVSQNSASFYRGENLQLSNTKKSPKVVIDQAQIATFQSNDDSRFSDDGRETMLLARIEQYRNEVAKKDAEIATLKRKVKELKILQKGMKDIDPDLVSLSIENTRLTTNLARLSDLTGGLGGDQQLPSIVALLYPPFSSAFMQTDENMRPASKNRPKSKDQTPIRQKPRACCRLVDNPDCRQPTVDYEELCRWVPSGVHKAVKNLTGRLGLPADKESMIKSFVVKVNQCMLARNHEAMTACANLCRKEVKEAKRSFVDAPIEVKSHPGYSKKKSDRAAFMEGAGWILAKLQTDLSLASKNIARVVNDVGSSAAAIISAMHYTNDNLMRVSSKMNSYERHIKEQMAEEVRIANQRRPGLRNDTFGTKEADRDERKADFGELSESF